METFKRLFPCKSQILYTHSQEHPSNLVLTTKLIEKQTILIEIYTNVQHQYECVNHHELG